MKGKKEVGAKGFEPSTSWSRSSHVNPITLYCGVAYGTRRVFSPLLVVPNLYLDRFRVESRLGVENRIPLRFFGVVHSSSDSQNGICGLATRYDSFRIATTRKLARPVNTSALYVIYPGACYATTNLLEPDSFGEFTSTRTAFIKHVDYFQVRRDRGVGGKAKAKSVISLNERAQTCRPNKHVLSLTSNDRFKAPRETLKTDFLLQRAVTFQHEPPARGRAIFDGVLQPLGLGLT
jgi:hypothetical protein